MTSVDQVADQHVVSEIFMIFQCISYFEHSTKMVMDMPDKVIGRIIRKYHMYRGDGEHSFDDLRRFIRDALTTFMDLYWDFHRMFLMYIMTGILVLMKVI